MEIEFKVRVFESLVDLDVHVRASLRVGEKKLGISPPPFETREQAEEHAKRNYAEYFSELYRAMKKEC